MPTFVVVVVVLTQSVKTTIIPIDLTNLTQTKQTTTKNQQTKIRVFNLNRFNTKLNFIMIVEMCVRKLSHQILPYADHVASTNVKVTESGIQW